MLLLVLNPELEQGCRRPPGFPGSCFDKPSHRGADVIAIGSNDIDRRARQQPALRSRVPWADRLVIRIEKIGKSRVRMKVSKNQVVCARCHLVGLTSGIDWID